MRIYILFLFTGFSSLLFSQQQDEIHGFSAFKKYDNSFVTPYLREKHSVSVGGLIGVYGSHFGSLFAEDADPITGARVDVIPSVGFHLGYNYMVLEQRRIKRSKKGNVRDEMALILGAHLSIFTNQEWMMMGTFYRQLIGFKSRFFSWSFLSEYGIGLHHTAAFLDNQRPFKIDLSLEVFRMRFVKQPLYLHAQFNYATSNDFLQKDKINVGLYGGLRYYLYKRKP